MCECESIYRQNRARIAENNGSSYEILSRIAGEKYFLLIRIAEKDPATAILLMPSGKRNESDE